MANYVCMYVSLGQRLVTGDLWSKVDSERHIFEKYFHDYFLFYPQSFYQKSVETKLPKKFFFL